MDRKEIEVIKARRKMIEEDAPCEECRATLASCKAARGKDPDAPSWFGCCARGLMLDVPCRHVPSHHELIALIQEIESGHVRHPDELLLDSVREFRIDPDRVMKWWRDNPDLAEMAAEDATWD